MTGRAVGLRRELGCPRERGYYLAGDGNGHEEGRRKEVVFSGLVDDANHPEAFFPEARALGEKLARAVARLRTERPNTGP